MQHRAWMLAALGALTLAGCATGINDVDHPPSRSFPVNMGFEAAYRATDAYARRCWNESRSTMNQKFDVSGNLYTDNGTGVVRVAIAGYTSDLERFDIARIDDATSRITVTVMGRGLLFDDRELERAAQSLTTGDSICR